MPLCLCALPSRKTQIAKQVPAPLWASHRVACEEGKTLKCLLLLCLCAFRQKNSKDFTVGPTMHSANDNLKSLCLCAIVPLCLAPEKTEIAPLCLCALRKKGYISISKYIYRCNRAFCQRSNQIFRSSSSNRSINARGLCIYRVLTSGGGNLASYAHIYTYVLR